MGQPVRLVDGTTVSMPDTAANQGAYPQSRGQKVGLGFPLCRVVGIVCLSSGAVLDAALGRFRGKGGDEQTLLKSMLDTLKTGDILLGDAYYATYFLLCELQRRGVDGVFEQYGARRRSTDFRLGQSLGSEDHLIELKKTERRPPCRRCGQHQRPEQHRQQRRTPWLHLRRQWSAHGHRCFGQPVLHPHHRQSHHRQSTIAA
jgi:hypothetical protein